MILRSEMLPGNDSKPKFRPFEVICSKATNAQEFVENPGREIYPEGNIHAMIGMNAARLGCPKKLIQAYEGVG